MRDVSRRALVVFALAIPIVLAIGIDLPLCPLASALDIPCPGCGLTRATLALLRGDAASAFHFHPLVFWVAPVYGFLLLGLLWSYLRGTPPATEPNTPPKRDLLTRLILGRFTSALAALTIGLLLIVWVARFCGVLGGPVETESFSEWRAKHSEHPMP